MVAALLTALFTVLLLGGLIFFHELGHYIFARWMGVHVVTFSIGFGPTLFKVRGRPKGELEPTEYVIGILPLGGFVRMLGADPSEAVPDAWRAASFQSKAVWKRFLIVAAGPAFNLILPYFIYLIAGLITAQQVPAWVGTVDVTGAAATAGLEPGDRVLAIDGDEVRYWWQLEQIISDAPSTKLAFTVERPGAPEPVTVEVVPEGRRRELLPGLAFGAERGRIGVMPAYARPFVVVAEGSPAWAAGLRTGDLVTAVDGQPVERFDQMAAALAQHPRPRGHGSLDAPPLGPRRGPHPGLRSPRERRGDGAPRPHDRRRAQPRPRHQRLRHQRGPRGHPGRQPGTARGRPALERRRQALRSLAVSDAAARGHPRRRAHAGVQPRRRDAPDQPQRLAGRGHHQGRALRPRRAHLRGVGRGVLAWTAPTWCPTTTASPSR
jgi:membrane-associated protease RseP (regulator of RpoE activity)